ncbi:class C sortase [Leucobacter sp. GX24907]
MSIVIEEARPPHETSLSKAKWRFPLGPFILAVIALVGLLVFMYPTVASWVAQYNQSQVIIGMEGSVGLGPQSRLDAELDRARAYNDALVGGAHLEANSHVPIGEGEESGGYAYDDLLNTDTLGTIGRLRIPAIHADLPIYHGTSDSVLERGVGHLRGTSLPIGGADQHSVLTAHRGLASAELFSNLDQVEKGDRFVIEVFGEVLTYQVITTQVVQPDETESLYPQIGEDLVTLVTCTPLGINTHRILVTGERIEPTPPEDLARAGSVPDVPGFPWWVVIISGTVVVLGGATWRAGVVRPMRGS